MKIISLNTWGGRAGKDNLLNFFNNHKKDADIFCLQEMWAAPYEHLEGESAGALAIRHKDIMVRGVHEVGELLSKHKSYFRPHHMDNYGLLMFVREELPVQGEGEIFVHQYKGFIPEGDIGHHARNIQYVTTQLGEKIVTVINFHGLWNGQGKNDSEDRINQSQRIIDFLKTLPGEIVLCGDFNLLPDTESIKLFESFGLRNLIKEFGITSTRTSRYTKADKFADYIFISKGLVIKDFKVLPDEVSDHAPLLLEIA